MPQCLSRCDACRDIWRYHGLQWSTSAALLEPIFLIGGLSETPIYVSTRKSGALLTMA